MASCAQRFSLFLIIAVLQGVLPATVTGQTPVDPDSVVVVANKFVPGSVKIARKYMKMRAIPKSNLITIRATDSETLSRESYLETIHNPLLKALIKQDLINAIPGKKDSLGRETATIFENPIRYIVLCYGVPTRVTNKPVADIDDLDLRKKRFTGKMLAVGQSFEKGKLAKNVASVDGELALLLRKDVPWNGFIPNPYYRNLKPEKVRDILKVMRLDGPSRKSVEKLLENTLIGERDGLKGMAYVDLDGRGGGYQIGNDWMARAAMAFEMLGFETIQHSARPTFPVDSRFDAPALYAGWYSGNVQGPFALPGFKFATGAVAAHLHSASASPLRSVDRAWVGPLIELGACATFGNVEEPYLQFTHNFDLYFSSLADGWNVADAAYYALPVLSWQAIAIGDPFYRPLAKSLGEQLENIGKPENSLEDQYVIIRKVNSLKKEQPETALKLAVQGMIKSPGPALGLVQAQLLEETGDIPGARRVLLQFSDIIPTDTNDWGLYAKIADTLLRLDDPDSSLRIYQNLEKVQMPGKVQLAFLKRGIQSANKAGEPRLASEWELLVNPPKPPSENTEKSRKIPGSDPAPQ